MSYQTRLQRLIARYQSHITASNPPSEGGSGVYERFEHPVLTRDNVPLTWRYDFDPASNPLLLERMGVNSTFNSGAIELDGKVHLVVRVEGQDRKSFFAIASSDSGVDNFRFAPTPIVLPQTCDPETNVYDMRLTAHEDGWIYGLFCAERKDNTQPQNPSAARADCGIVRTRDLRRWERLPDLVSGPQQRNVVLHPEFVSGKYALYTRPADSFIDTGSQSGIGWALVDSMEDARITHERIIDQRIYHTVKEVKNGAGAAPIKTPAGWLHFAHGVRGHACGLRYVLYVFMTSLEDPSKVIYSPAGHFLCALGDERLGDTTCNVFSNGAVLRSNGDILVYYGASDTRLCVVRTSLERMVDYCQNTPADGFRSAECVRQRVALIERNRRYIEASGNPLLQGLL